MRAGQFTSFPYEKRMVTLGVSEFCCIRMMLIQNSGLNFPILDYQGTCLSTWSTKYKFAHTSIRSIQLSNRILPEACNFLLGIRNHFVASHQIPRKRKLPPTTPEGKVYIDTILFVCGEGRRFSECMELTCHGLKSIKPVSPCDRMQTMIKSYGNGCEHMLSLHLAELEEDMGLINSVHDLARHGFRRIVAEAALKDLQLKTKGMLRCTGPNKQISLEYLCGGDIFLIKHEKELVNKILMRKKGYRGPFVEQVKFVVDANGTWRKDKLAITKEDIEEYFRRREGWSLKLASLTVDGPNQHSSGPTQHSLGKDLQMLRYSDAGGSSCQNEAMETNLDAGQSLSKNDEDLSEQVMMPLQGVQSAQEPSSSAIAGVDVLQEKVVQIIKVQTESRHEGCFRRKLVLHVLMEFMWLLSPGVDSRAATGGDLHRMKAEEAIDKLLNGEGMQDIVKTIGTKVFSKEILFELLTECIGLFPNWLEENKGQITEEQCEQFQKQLHLIVDLTMIYNDNPNDLSKIMKLLYKIGGYGLPPGDIVRRLSPWLVEQLLKGMLELLDNVDIFFPLYTNHPTK